MKKIDILNLSKYLRRTGDNKLARVGHVNYALDEITEEIAEAVTRDYVLTTGLVGVSGLNIIDNYTITVQGDTYNVYSGQAYTQLSGSNIYIYPLGFLTINSPLVFASNNSSVVFANDSVLQQVLTSLGIGALVTETSTGDVFPVSFMSINIDNTITTPDEYYIFLIAADPVTFECNVSMDIQVAVIEGATVEYNVI